MAGDMKESAFVRFLTFEAWYGAGRFFGEVSILANCRSELLAGLLFFPDGTQTRRRTSVIVGD